MRRHALLIGCNEGKDLFRLNAAESDAVRMRDMLCRHTSWEASCISVLLGEVTKRIIEKSICDLKQRIAPGDFVLVYYAGHATVQNSQYYLCLPKELYEMNDILEAFVTTEDQIHSFLLVDACFSGRAAASAFGAFLGKLFKKSADPQMGNSLLARVVFTGSAPDQPARERASGGLMTSGFLLAAECGGTDLRATALGVATFDTVVDYVREELESKQIPIPATYGKKPDIKTVLEWRLKFKTGSREYQPGQFLMLAEDTRMWYPTEPSRTDLLSISWGGDGSKDLRKVALNLSGQNVKIFKLDQVQRKVIDVSELPCASVGNGIRVSPTGEFVAVLSQDDRLSVYQTSPHPKPIKEFNVSPNRFLLTPHNLLVTCSPKGIIEAWSLKSQRNEPLAESSSNLRLGNHMRAFPNESAVIIGSLDAGQALKCTLPDPNAHSASARNALIGISVISPEPVGTFGKPFGQALRVAVSPEGDKFAVGFGGQPGRVRVWDANAPSSPITNVLYPEHKSLITSLEFSADGMFVASGSADGEVYLTALEERKQPRCIRLSDDDYVTALAFSPKGQDPALVIGTRSGKVEYYVLADSTVRSLDNPGRNHVYRLAILANADHPAQVLVGAQRGFECWDVSI